MRWPVVSNVLRWTPAALALCLAGGCAERHAATPPAEQRDAAASSAVNAASEAKTQAETNAAPHDSAAPSSQAAADAAAYTPPFPDRVDLFVPPKRQGGPVAKALGESAVELMGFVRVDRSRAILAINGEVTPMAEGETQFGIKVISVHPPNVILQRGRQRWQATLE